MIFHAHVPRPLLKLLLILSFLALPFVSLAYLSAADPQQPAAALVDGKPILVSQLQQEFQSITSKLTLTEKARNQIAQELLEQVIQRRLVMAYLQRTGQAASRADLLVAREKLTLRLALEKKSLEEYLLERKLNEQQLDFQLSWQLGWPLFLNKYVTDDNLQRYFDQHREQFDGTERRVVHILLKVTDREEIELLRARQVSLRQQISKGDLTFAQAAMEYSQSPSATQGGDIGWINWNGPMPRAFTDAAFATELGTVSQPVQSKFGIHLVKCVEIKKGTGSWQEARDPLRNAIVRYLFSWAADQQREHSVIKRTGLWPQKAPREP